MRPGTAVSPAGARPRPDVGVSAATDTVEPGASINEPPWNHAEPAVIVMLPGVKIVPGAEVAVCPSVSGNTVVTEPGPKVSRPARCASTAPPPWLDVTRPPCPGNVVCAVPGAFA